METITYKMQFTFPKASVIAFAKFIGYQEMVSEYSEENPTIPIGTIQNPENVFDFVARMAREHNQKFVTIWADFLVQKELGKQIDAIKPQIEQAIVKPVVDAIQVTYE